MGYVALFQWVIHEGAYRGETEEFLGKLPESNAFPLRL